MQDDEYEGLLNTYKTIVCSLIEEDEYFSDFDVDQIESIIEETTKWFGKETAKLPVQAGLKRLIETLIPEKEDG